ncbi:MAG: leishmanolysin-related zinc metalloendopeptidase [Pseudomonadota bacterium]
MSRRYQRKLDRFLDRLEKFKGDALDAAQAEAAVAAFELAFPDGRAGLRELRREWRKALRKDEDAVVGAQDDAPAPAPEPAPAPSPVIVVVPIAPLAEPVEVPAPAGPDPDPDPDPADAPAPPAEALQQLADALDVPDQQIGQTDGLADAPLVLPVVERPIVVLPDPDPAPEPEPEPEPEPAPTPEPGPPAQLVDAHRSGLAQGDPADVYNIDVIFEGQGWTVAAQQAVIRAAEYISTLVTEDVAAKDGVDDLQVTFTIQSIDGAFGVVGSANPTALRIPSWMPSEGEVILDAADLQRYVDDGRLDDLAAHEIMHVMGFGPLWSAMGLRAILPDGDARFTGEAATAAYAAAYPDLAGADPDAALGVPVETDGGPGSAYLHWDDFTFRDELMTSSLNTSNPVSAMTVAALEDMGYATVWDAADPGSAPLQLDDQAWLA